MIKHLWAIAFLLLSAAACQSGSKPAINLEEGPARVELFGPGLISTSMSERDLAVTPDGTEIVYTLGNYTQSQRCLVTVKHSGGKWTEPEILPFSGKYKDIEPFFTPDGKRLFFASNRPVDSLSHPLRSDFNIWVVGKTAMGWGTPQPLGTLINSPEDEYYPAVASNGNLYFTSARESGPGKEDIYMSPYVDDAYGEPFPLDSTINTATYEFNAYVSPDENHIFFSSYGRPDDLGGGDLYYSSRNKTGRWNAAINLGPEINSEYLDYCPFFDLPRGIFYFTSNRQASKAAKFSSTTQFIQAAQSIENGLDNIYRIPFTAIPLPDNNSLNSMTP